MTSIPSSGFSFTGWLAQASAHVPSIFAGRKHLFRREDCDISVSEERTLSHSSSSAVRARCNDSGVEFDIRRLRVGAEAGGLVTLAMFETLERESHLAGQAGGNPHIVQCFATLIDNSGTDHCRLLLRDPCCMDLSTHLKATGGALDVDSVSEIGQHLSLGLRHLHGLDILCGSVTPQGVLLGCDGKWKLLGDLSGTAELFCNVEEWRLRRLAATPADAKQPLLPPEARQKASTEQQSEEVPLVTPALDIWMLGALLAGLLQGVDDRGIGGHRAGHAILAATDDVLLCSAASRFWLLLHWLLASEPVQRPWSRSLVEIIHSLSEWCPQDFLIEMPEYARFHCQAMATAAARRLAFAGVAGAGANRRCAVGLPLEVLRQSLADSSSVDQLCENCGLMVGEFPSTPEEDLPDIPCLVPMLCCVDAAPQEELCSPKERCPSRTDFQTDDSTDEGTSSGDESTLESDRSSTRRRMPSYATALVDDDGSSFFGDEPKILHSPAPIKACSVIPRQRRPTACSPEA